VADLSRDELQRLARLGARSRLEEIRREEAAIRRTFPDLFGRGRGRQAGVAPGRRRRGMSAAARKAVSIRMRRYWAKRRQEKAAKAR
jgi:hypothetical protein